jgi:broad specificity phosphatase PhoE
MNNIKKQIYFLRSAPYDYAIPGVNLYQSFNLVARKVLSPPIQENKIDNISRRLLYTLKDTQVVFSSAQKRSIDTAKLIGKNVKVLDVLKEVEYFMEDFITEEEFYENGVANVQKARTAFVHGFIENKLQEKYVDVISRIEILLSILYNVPEDKVVLFSHGFYLKIIEAYIKEPEIKDNPNNLLSYFDGKSETFKFCEGFIITQENDTVTFDRYLKNS